MSNKTSFSPVQVISLEAGSDTPEHRFIGFNGSVTSNPESVVGVSYLNVKRFDLMPIITLGTAIIETSEPISKGAKVSATADGKAKITGEDEKVNGRAISNTTASGYITILLTP